MNLAEVWRRWRTTLGYGVHSPLAYTLVKDVIKPPRNVIYYGEEILENSSESNYKHILRARLLLRFAAKLQPAIVWVSKDIPEIYISALNLAGGVVRIFDGNAYPDEARNADMVILENVRIKKTILAEILKPGKCMVAFDMSPSFLQNSEKLLQGGVLLNGGNSMITVASKGSSLHKYLIQRF